MMMRQTQVGVFEDLMKDPHLRDLVGQGDSESEEKGGQPMKPTKVNGGDTAPVGAETQGGLNPTAPPPTTTSSIASSGVFAPLHAAKEAVKSITAQISALQTQVTWCEDSERDALAELESNREGLKRAREDRTRHEQRVAELEKELAVARSDLQSSKEREASCVQGIDLANHRLRQAQAEKGRSLSQFNAAANAQKHLEESFHYLEQIGSDSAPAQSPPKVVEVNPLRGGEPAKWPWDEGTRTNPEPGAVRDPPPEGEDPMSMPNPYTDEGAAPAKTVQPKAKMSVEEKARREEMAARVEAVQRSKREKEAILQARLASKAKRAAQSQAKPQPQPSTASAPPKVVLKTSELLNLQKKKNEEHLAELKRQQQQRQEEAAAAAAEAKLAKAKAAAAAKRDGEAAEEVTRDDVRDELEKKIFAYMPQEHEFRDASRGSVPERSRACSGGLCNRHCSRACLDSCTAGFLMALEIPVRGTLMDTVNKAMRKYHPDRNSERRVGRKKALWAEEVCKDLSLLASIAETINEVTFVLIFEESTKLPKMRVTLPLDANVGELKRRVVQDYDELSLESLRLSVGGREMRDSKTLSECGIKENCIVNVKAKEKTWTQF